MQNKTEKAFYLQLIAFLLCLKCFNVNDLIMTHPKSEREALNYLYCGINGILSFIYVYRDLRRG